MISDCFWTAQGAFECQNTSSARENVLETFSSMGYSFNVFLFDKEGRLVFRQQFVNKVPEGTSAFLTIHPHLNNAFGQTMRLIVNDITEYSFFASKLPPLQLIIDVGYDSLIPMQFSKAIPMLNFYTRTAQLDIYNYKGVTFHFRQEK